MDGFRLLNVDIYRARRFKSHIAIREKISVVVRRQYESCVLSFLKT